MRNVENEGPLKVSRIFVFVSGVASMVVSVIMITLTILSILAYNCTFYSPMRRTPLSYMMFLLYFRSSECQRFIHWGDLGLSIFITDIQPDIPDVSAATLRTFILTCLYLSVNVLLMITSILLLISLKREGKCRFFTYGIFVVPFLFVSFLVFILDIVAISFYSVDVNNHSTPSGLMQSMEITNPLFLPMFEEIPTTVRTLPSLIMLAAASKLIIIFLLNCAMFVGVMIGGWNVVKINERHQNLSRIDFQNIANSNPSFDYISATPPQTNDSDNDQLNSGLMTNR